MEIITYLVAYNVFLGEHLSNALQGHSFYSQPLMRFKLMEYLGYIFLTSIPSSASNIFYLSDGVHYHNMTQENLGIIPLLCHRTYAKSNASARLLQIQPQAFATKLMCRKPRMDKCTTRFIIFLDKFRFCPQTTSVFYSSLVLPGARQHDFYIHRSFQSIAKRYEVECYWILLPYLLNTYFRYIQQASL
ncbi:hypothetical protein CEXT_758631 [Caerostris extrusa]|uniref:Maturase K n=1 Tax=Caerostris extrusa TaxID=172846 RepID=A0AAV4Q3M5_CAEEX|nr:hypothetical protein CEXT_758631 [Caerostris extrusa]